MLTIFGPTLSISLKGADNTDRISGDVCYSLYVKSEGKYFQGDLTH